MKNTIDFNKGEKKIARIALSAITTSHNPRRPIRELQSQLEADIALGTRNIPANPLELVHKFALNTDADKKKVFTDLIERYEPSIVSLAASRDQDEIEPIMLRSFRAKLPGSNEYVEKYGVVVGERRIIAAAYSYAKNGGEIPTIGAVVRKLTVDEAFDLAVAENAHRVAPTAIEEGKVFHQYRKRENPVTGKNYSLLEISKLLNLEYPYVRTREALTYLSDSDQRRVETGKLGIVAASVKGLAIKNGKDTDDLPDKKNKRDRAMTLMEVQKHFDANRNCFPGDDLLNTARTNAYLEALAAVMKISFDDAIEQSDKRIGKREEDELIAARKVDKKYAGKC